MADSFEFSQQIDLDAHQSCAQRLFEDSKDANPKHGQQGQPGHSESAGGLTPFFGVLNETTPGQPLAFDSNFRKLDFGPSASAMDKFEDKARQSNNLQFDHKFSAALIFGLHMKF